MESEHLNLSKVLSGNFIFRSWCFWREIEY